MSATVCATTLKLASERKICDLVRCEESSKRWEASGILAKDGRYFVVFDDRAEIACISANLQANDQNAMCGTAYRNSGYEGITYNADKKRFYLLVEARKQSKGCYHALIVEYDDKFQYVKNRPADFTFESDNKGFEAITHVRRDGKDYLLALCEGNWCKCGKKGRTPGGGRVHVFQKKRKYWEHIREIALPHSLPFVDYSGMSLDNGRLAVVSQENSMLWVGQFNTKDWTWRDEGQIYEFPRSDDGEILYGNIEGVAWIAPSRIVAVSDRRKKSSQPDKRLSDKDQSLHVFEIPE
jgi:hypothetical protein